MARIQILVALLGILLRLSASKSIGLNDVLKTLDLEGSDVDEDVSGRAVDREEQSGFLARDKNVGDGYDSRKTKDRVNRRRDYGRGGLGEGYGDNGNNDQFIENCREYVNKRAQTAEECAFFRPAASDGPSTLDFTIAAKCRWDTRINQGSCLCPRTEPLCYSKKLRGKCYWLGKGSSSYDDTESQGICITNAEKFYNVLGKLLLKRGKKDFAVRINYSSSPASGQLPYGPNGPSIVDYGPFSRFNGNGANSRNEGQFALGASPFFNHGFFGNEQNKPFMKPISEVDGQASRGSLNNLPFGHPFQQRFDRGTNGPFTSPFPTNGFNGNFGPFGNRFVQSTQSSNYGLPVQPVNNGFPLPLNTAPAQMFDQRLSRPFNQGFSNPVQPINQGFHNFVQPMNQGFPNPGQPINQGYGQPVNQGFGQSVNGFSQSVNQGISQPVVQPLDQGFSQPAVQPINQGFSNFVQPINQGFPNPGQPINQGYGQPVNQGFGQPINQGFGQPINQGFGQPVNNGFGQPVVQPLDQGFSQPAVQPTDQGFGQQPADQGFQQPALQPVDQAQPVDPLYAQQPGTQFVPLEQTQQARVSPFDNQNGGFFPAPQQSPNFQFIGPNGAADVYQ